MRDASTEDSGGLEGDSLDVKALLSERGWSRSRLVSELRKVAAREGRQLPGDESLIRMIRLWVNGTRIPSADYDALLRRALGVSGVAQNKALNDDFEDMLDRGDSAVDPGLVELLLSQTQTLRGLDRRLGARRVLAQSEAHARTMADLVQWAPLGRVRADLAAGAAAASGLAAWQALDLGLRRRAWDLYNQARGLGRESGDASQLGHVTAAQGYVLLDSNRIDRAIAHFEMARKSVADRVPGVMVAWLSAAEAEARAAAGDRKGALALLDVADTRLTDDEVPGIFLDASHLARWRGHCMARLGDPEAIDMLNRALAILPGDFSRAAAGLHVDLATAHTAAGNRDAAREHARAARKLSLATDSARQQTRLRAAESE